ncbi:pyridoxamine 5'-phosphate oxidase family protein [Salipiger sp. IMCC34102]|uniref:MSMEG_1061 family FMN-dependent PPOX-type flavoprotein n=1 Tax=Salipiger sp. IMCC34102 TaxID=2510647 RepID=UPI00101B7D93|nr:MSMEG_1061 family FMN-dependent PPOX-type flavoprotein [Salipiger sp. IMCC34102]RYH01382.1 pyridoxamine 5'-phosphate oxidase family protein [Salipiger sp. IMCC34102]
MTPLSVDDLDALYGAPSERSLTKVQDHLTPSYRAWIAKSRFVVVSTVGPEGTDGSPRGDAGPVVRIADDRTVLLPDWKGNNRLDSLRNIARDGRVSLMFMVPGSTSVVRVNGTGIVTTDADTVQGFSQSGKHPLSVVVVSVHEVYFQCAKAIMRADLWTGEDRSNGLPTAGELLREADGETDARAYDADYPDYARTRMW